MAETLDQYAHSSLNDPDSELFSSDLITRFYQDAENFFAVDCPCIDTRIALSVTSGTANYTLSDDVLSIRRITWKGKKLDPLPHRDFRSAFQSASQVGTPFWYVYNNIRQNVIKFFPAPNETIASTTSDLYGSEIANRVIVDYWRTPDFSNYIIPAYFRRRLIKTYMMSSCLAVEGEGQHLKGSKYFRSRWEFLKNLYSILLYELHNKPRKLVVSGFANSGGFPGQPILPMDRFGVSCDAGE